MVTFVMMVFSLALPPAAAAGGQAAAPSPPARFSADVAPILLRECQGCHGPDRAKGGYRLDTFARLMRPGDSGDTPVTPGKPDGSTLYRRITADDEKVRMPQKDDPLPPAQVALIERWIRAGAAFDGADSNVSLATVIPAAPHPAAPAKYPRPAPILALAFGPDGKELAASGYHEITVWDAGSGKLLRRVGDLPQQVHSIAWSPDGAWLAVAGGTPGSAGEVRLVPAGASTSSSAPAGTPLVLDRIADMMLSVDFSGDGKRLGVGGADGCVRLYELTPSAPPAAPAVRRSHVISQHSDWVTAVALSPDGRRVASASRDKTARVFDAATGATQSAYFGHDGPVFSVSWDADGDVWSAGRDREAHAWEPATEGKRQAVIKGFGGDVLRLVRGREFLFSAGADGKVRQHKLSDRAEVRTYEASSDWIYGLAFDGKLGRVAAGSFDGTVRVFATDDGARIAEFVAAPGYGVP